jgi:hypothetical protein
MVRTQIILKENQRKALEKIANQENRSLSDLIREFIDEQLCMREERQMAKAAEFLREDYIKDKELTAFAILDSEEFYEEG